MSAMELKEKLIAKIRQTNDEGLLEELSSLIELQEAEGTYMLSESQKEAVAEARAQIRNGESYTNDEANKEIDQWLSERIM